VSFLINQLKQFEKKGLKWVCRMSHIRSGLQLHQVEKRDEQYHRTFDTPAEAIIDYVDREGGRLEGT